MRYHEDLLLFWLLDNVINHRWETVHFDFMPTVRVWESVKQACHWVSNMGGLVGEFMIVE